MVVIARSAVRHPARQSSRLVFLIKKSQNN